MTRQEAIEKLKRERNGVCRGCFHPSVMGWCENHCKLPEAYDMAIDALRQPEIIQCKDCKHNVSSHKCLHPESFFLVPSDDFYCGYAKRRTDEK